MGNTADKTLATQINYVHVKDVVDNITSNQMILYPNTNSGYGSRTDGEVTEENNLTPVSHYGVTKCDSENFVKSHGKEILIGTNALSTAGEIGRLKQSILENRMLRKINKEKKAAEKQK